MRLPGGSGGEGLRRWKGKKEEGGWERRGLYNGVFGRCRYLERLEGNGRKKEHPGVSNGFVLRR